jgi:vanillate O-demethylase monooxygenase subunit
MEAAPDAVFYNLNIDAGAMWARRIQERMIDDETPPPALRAAE